MTEEIWKDIKGYEGYYQVSNLGRIKSMSRNLFNGKVYWKSKERILKLGKRDKYIGFTLCKNGEKESVYLHKTVLETFDLEVNKEVNHINGIKTDNRLENLEWVTHKENMKHAYESGLTFTRKVINRDTNEIYFSIKEASEILNIDYNHLKSQLRRNKHQYLKFYEKSYRLVDGELKEIDG